VCVNIEKCKRTAWREPDGGIFKGVKDST